MTDKKLVYDSESPAHGQQVISACAFIHKNIDGVEKVLLLQRSEAHKFLPGVYEVPGGHINFGEDIKEGLQREILEEAQIHLNVGDPFCAFTYVNELKGSHSIEVIFFATIIDENEAIILDPDDHSDYGWFTEDEIHDVAYRLDHPDDPEVAAIYQAFALLRGEQADFGAM